MRTHPFSSTHSSHSGHGTVMDRLSTRLHATAIAVGFLLRFAALSILAFLLVSTPMSLREIPMPATVLLLATESAGQPAVDALRRALDADIELLPALRPALARLRQRDFSLVLLDENMAAADPDSVERLYQITHAPIVELNFAISSAPRIVRQARAALARRSRDLALAESTAASTLQCELNETLAGLLLESELALRAATPTQAPKLRQVVDLACHLRDRLRPGTPIQL